MKNKLLKMTHWGPFWILLVRNLSWGIIVFQIYGPAILLFFALLKSHKITQIQNGR